MMAKVYVTYTTELQVTVCGVGMWPFTALHFICS